MSIRSVVTRGYGSGGSISLVVVRGYGTVAAPTPSTTDTHDGGFGRREQDEIRKRLRRVEASRNKSDKARLDEERLLAASVERAYRRVVEGLPDPVAAKAILAAANVPMAASDGATAFVPDWNALARDVEAVHRLLAVLDERAREEDDMEILLLAM